MNNLRHRFGFSLRTLLVVVTLACGWLGYRLSWIRERHALYAELTAQQWEWRPGINAPQLLRIFGEPGYKVVIAMEMMPTEHDRQRIRRIFPEARIWHVVSDESLESIEDITNGITARSREFPRVTR